ncbi:MAG: SMI1/KNR4 family protein [Colwellia sp.]|nr:SMI1/KNR4 family protein [Colwellia sp.]
MPFPVDEKYIVQTEEKLAVRFPHSFKEKMKKENGGEVETPPDAWLLYPFFDTSDRKRLKRTTNDIIKETKSAQEWTGFPNNTVTIGSNGSGDQLVFLRLESTKATLGNTVYCWDHETGNLNKLANDFSELLDKKA